MSAGLDYQSKDAMALASLGYKQEFRRVFGAIEIFGVVFSALCIVPALSTVLVYALPNGGPVAMVWGWTVVTPFTVCVALALADLASSAPTSGGLYYWTHRFASPRWKNILAWIVGYTNTLAYITGISAANWGIALMIAAAGAIGTDGSWTPTTAQIYAISVALGVSQAIASSLASNIISRLQWLYIAFNIALVLIILIGLPISTPSASMNTASYVFGHFENLTEWKDGFAFVLSFLAPLFAFAGYDAPIHLSEEVSNAKVAVPWAIVSAVALGSVLGWALNVVIAFCMGPDLVAILSDPVGQPMAVILLNSFGKTGMLAIWSLFVITYWMAITSLMVSGSRQVYAFSRDGALPFSSVLYRINSLTGTPVNCVWFTAILSLLPSLLAFAGTAAISAVFTMVIIGLYITYAIPICSRFLSNNDFVPGPFSLGRMSAPVAFLAVSWMVFAIIILLFPASPAPTPEGMNYAIVVMGGVIALAIAYFYFPLVGGRLWFTGPRRTVGDECAGAKDGSMHDTGEGEK
ncbi:APC amino acid permease [Punctularia strigosozonata HHB-11173 SS5]|uniref:APC amino acid permease n=1 Tax=Punctularia strigosozonata (strain HHB-11173) TaxID=741275 RepID=R7S4F4_PUNST|nr:APC amino acid permease [Punctularia strigosozonata HHB-11173 SS5]EIN04131.1 APC amino acid permease [Punctularia strigosozonata HHB-11173 SS5]